MPTPRPQRILILLLALSVSCAEQTPRSPGLSPVEGLPTIAETDSPPTPLPALQPTLSPSALTIILGRPTAESITVSLLSSTAQTITISYGTESGKFTTQTDPIIIIANVPQTIELSNLTPDTSYFYSINGIEHTFHTARAPGSTFTFTIDADPHNRDPRFDSELYATTLTNARADRPDFHINLGDTFMTEKLKPQSYEEAESTFTDMRPYFGILSADAPLFLVNGNHEGELGWLLNGKDKNIPIWSTELRQLYYPNPTPNDFYSGDSTPDTTLGAVRDGYYAWNWSDALFIVLDPFWYTTSKPKPDDQNNNWGWTLGREQNDWLKSTLETSDAKFKFIFIHHLVGGDKDGRGGIEFANLFEWGGDNADGSYGFDAQRPGWGMPIHQLLVQNHVSAVFHGHDHVFVKQELDGIIYQECPQPSNTQPDNTHLAAEYGYVNGEVVAGSGYLRVNITPEQVTVEFIRAYWPQDEKSAQQDGQVNFSYTIK